MQMVNLRQAVAVRLFRLRLISLAGAARLANESIAAMLTRLARMGIAVADYDGPTLAREVKTARDWINPKK